LVAVEVEFGSLMKRKERRDEKGVMISSHDEAVFLFEGGEEWSLGIDLYEWKLSSRSAQQTTTLPVRGIRKVPPNVPHFLRYQVTSENAKDKFGGDATGNKLGFFAFLRPGELKLFRWNEQKEEFVGVEDEDEVDRYRLGFQQHAFDQVTIGYPTETLDMWIKLSCLLTQKTIDRLRAVTSESNAPNFTPVVLSNKKKIDPNELRGLSAEEITRMHLDHSYVIEKLLSESPFKDGKNRPVPFLHTQLTSSYPLFRRCI